MNPTIDLIQAHRSIRRFTDQPIEEELLHNILLAGQAAATSSFIQATTAIRITYAELREQFVELSGNQKYVGTAAEFFVMCADMNRNLQRARSEGTDADYGWTEQFITATVDVALFAQNMVVAAQSEGLGICYIGGIRNQPERVRELLSLPKCVYPVFGLCLGYPDQQPEQKPRLPNSVVVHENQYHRVADLAEQIDDYDDIVRNYYLERTGGKLNTSWSEQIAKQAAKEKRPFMLGFLQEQQFLRK